METELKIKKLEKRLKALESHAKKNKVKYPIYTDGKMWVSPTHWYYN